MTPHRWTKRRDDNLGVKWQCVRCSYSVLFFRGSRHGLDGYSYTSGRAVFAHADDGDGLDRAKELASGKSPDCDLESVRAVMES